MPWTQGLHQTVAWILQVLYAKRLCDAWQLYCVAISVQQKKRAWKRCKIGWPCTSRKKVLLAFSLDMMTEVWAVLRAANIWSSIHRWPNNVRRAISRFSVICSNVKTCCKTQTECWTNQLTTLQKFIPIATQCKFMKMSLKNLCSELL